MWRNGTMSHIWAFFKKKVVMTDSSLCDIFFVHKYVTSGHHLTQACINVRFMCKSDVPRGVFIIILNDKSTKITCEYSFLDSKAWPTLFHSFALFCDTFRSSLKPFCHHLETFGEHFGVILVINWCKAALRRSHFGFLMMLNEFGNPHWYAIWYLFVVFCDL